jgi:hypothetical protein
MVSALTTKEGETMQSLDVRYVSKVCPELTESECEALLCHARDITRSDNDIYPDMLRSTSRSLFPHIERRAPISPGDLANDVAIINRFRIAEAIANLEAAQDWLGKVRSPSDDVAMAVRDTGMIADRLRGVKHGD